MDGFTTKFTGIGLYCSKPLEEIKVWFGYNIDGEIQPGVIKFRLDEFPVEPDEVVFSRKEEEIKQKAKNAINSVYEKYDGRIRGIKLNCVDAPQQFYDRFESCNYGRIIDMMKGIINHQ